MSNTSWTRKFAFLAIIWTVAVIVLLAIAELVLRVTAGPWDDARMINVLRDTTYVYDTSKLYPDGPDRVVYRRDQYGLRDDCASPADIDILTIGGSTTDQRMVPFESTYQKVMESELGQAIGRKVCVSNAGVDGHSSYGHVRAFRDWLPLIPGLKPKIVLFYVGINDAMVIDEGPSWADRRIDQPELIRRLKVAQLADWARMVVYSYFHRPEPHQRWDFDPADYTVAALKSGVEELSDANAEHFRGRLRTLLSEARKIGAEPVCVTQPTRFVLDREGKSFGLKLEGDWNKWRYSGLDFDYSLKEINEVMRQECGRDRVIDLYRAPFDPRIFYDEIHTGPEGSREVGHAMAAWLSRSRFADEWKH